LSAFTTLCEAYLGIWPNVELFRRLFFLLLQDPDTGFDSGAMRGSLLLCPHNYRIPEAIGEGVLQEVAVLLLLLQEPSRGR
jgi:hypothetical protein